MARYLEQCFRRPTVAVILSLTIMAGCAFLLLNEPVSYAELGYTESSYALGAGAGSIIPASCESNYEHTAGECADVWWCDSQSGLGDAWCTNQCCTRSDGSVQCGTNGGTNTIETTSVTDDNAIANGWCTTDTTTVTNSCGIGDGTSSNTQCSCDANYTMSGGVCVSCITTSPGTYTDPDATPNGWCTNNWTNNYNTCTGVNTITDLSTICSCDAGYTMSGGVCVLSCPVTTSPGTYTDPDATPNGWCTNNWTNNYNTCTGVNTITDLSTICSCDAGYTMSGGVCVANTIPVNGECGPAATSYASNETAYSGALCKEGNASPASPAFPAQGGSSSWTCQGVNGGTNSPACLATRDSAVTYFCTGTVPANAGPYDAEESSSLTSDTAWIYAGTDTATKCQYHCTSGTWDGASCVVVVSGVCSGTADTTVTGSLSGGSVWGTDIYTDDSDVGKAAVHAGILAPGESAVIRKTFRGMRTDFIGSTRNGVNSWGYAPEWCSMTLSLISAAPPPPQASGNINSTTCEIGANASTCDVTVTWDTTKATNVDVKAGSTLISSGKVDNQGGLLHTVTYGDTIFALYESSALLDAKTITVGCIANHVWFGGRCIPSFPPPSLSVSKQTVPVGNSITLSWDTNNGDETSCSLNGKGVSDATLDAGGGGTNETGSVNVVINGRTTFTLMCGALSSVKTVEIIPSSWES